MAVEEVGEYNPRELEEWILWYWRENKVMQKTLQPREGELFSFLEGPPTANAPPALHHVEARTFKDIVNRFQFMQGKSVPRKAGWDCHGLPVEVQVEKDLDLESKKDIVEYGVDRFVEKCRESVFSHIKEWDSLTERMAYWIDLENPYVTMADDYIESVWWSLKQLWDKKLLYEGYRVVPYCPRCGTPLSSHEVAQGYKSIKEETVIVSLRAKERDFSFLAWTTTPWTLLSNVALAVNPDIKYAVIKFKGENYVLAKDLAEKRFPEAGVVEEIKGSELAGMEYYPVFTHFTGKVDKPAWRVVTGDFVTTEEGTGIVHIAPAFGEDDYIVGEANGMPLINPVELDGKFNSDVPELEGEFVKDADHKIINWLDEMGVLVAKYPYEHDYPFCWRCKTPLLYYAMKSWFVKVSDVVPSLLDKNSEVAWYPESIGTGRFGKWIENARDWGLSRNRFWGTPLPIWRCECGDIRVVGSRKELLENSVGEVKEDIELHRPYVDAVKFKCNCGKEMERVEYVIDCWYDSGAATFAQFHYPFENKELFENSFPYSFICEATDQTRGWFYTLLVLATVLFDKPAYLNCVVAGLLLDDNGEKMSKSNDNIIDPWELFNSVGADAVRLQMCSSAPWNARRFGLESMNENVVPMLRTLWNCYSFTVRYLTLDGFDPREADLEEAELTIEDQWILSAADSMVDSVRRSLESNDYHHTLSKISDFIVEDFSRWYIKLVRDRLWLEGTDGGMNPLKKSAYISLMVVFDRICIALAPLAPFMSEAIYVNLVKRDVPSVHLVSWPFPGKVDEELISQMRVVRRLFEAGSRCRQEAKIKLRYPIAKVRVSGDSDVKAAVERLQPVILKQLNCKAVEYVDSLPDVRYAATPDFSVIGPKHGKDANRVSEAIKSNPAEAKSIRESGNPGKIGDFEVTPGMISDIKLSVPEKYAAAQFSEGSSHGVVLIETERSETLLKEALARDLIRNVQELRKKNNLEELQRINVEVSKSEKVEAMLSEFKDMILEEVRAEGLNTVENLETPENFKYEGETVFFKISY
ncbi:MAG: isoleucine--tRNA ligase [Candidatus Altiarchaeales archaeon]|nr:isoleucine--tRNA ligase [Candidatus Altiarchaeales archaeon]MBD3415668.1 isoleucine--tRNA ligase [Candidatus Altiarchaeales archaeon]